MSRLSRQCEILNISQPYRPPRPVTGLALLITAVHFGFRGSTAAESQHGGIRTQTSDYAEELYLVLGHVQSIGNSM
jgi:hypothetical protein